MRKTIIQVGGALVSAALSTISTSLNILGITNNAPFIVRWFPLITLMIFFGFVAWAWYDMRKRIQELEGKQSTVKVEPILEGKFARLRITNTGKHQVSFSTKVSEWEGIQSVTPLGTPYDAKWRNRGDSPNLDLMPGDSEEVEIIQNEGQTLNDEGRFALDLQKVEILNPNHSVSKVPIDSELRFSVQVFASPQLKSPFKRTYALVVGNEKWTQFGESGEQG